MSYCVIISTAPHIDTAKQIAQELVRSKLAACVNLIPQVISVYCWNNQIQEDSEVLLKIKTKKVLFEKVKESIISLHPYELPEIISIPIENGLDGYLNWINEETCTL